MRRALLLAALSSAWALAAGPTAACAAAQAPVTRTVLPNGLRVLTRHEPGTGFVALSVFVRAGTPEENGRWGAAALVARSLFGDSTNLTRESASREIAFAGGAMEARWDADYTLLSCLTTAGAFEDAIYVIAQGLREARFDRVTLARARTDITAELQRRGADLVEAGARAALPALYVQSAYRVPPGGTPEDVARLTAADAARLHARAYTPGRTVVTVVGDIDPQRAVREVENCLLYGYDRREPRTLPYAPQPEPPLASGRAQATGPGGAALVMAAYRAPALTDPDYPAARVLTALVGGGKGSRLFRELRQDAGVGYVVGARLDPRAAESPLFAWAQVDPERRTAQGAAIDLADLERRLLSAVGSVLDAPPTERELERARRYAVGTHLLAHERVADRAYHIGWQELLGAGYAEDEALAGRMQAVTADDVQRVARRCLRRRVVVWVTPRGVPAPDGPTTPGG